MASYETAKTTAQHFANKTGDNYCIYRVRNGQWMFSSEAFRWSLPMTRFVADMEIFKPMITKHKTDASKVLHAWKLYPRTFTFGERTFTLVKGTWDDDELVGAIYTDQNKHEWLIYNDTGIERIEDSVNREIVVLGSRGAELLKAVKELHPAMLTVTPNRMCHRDICSAEECVRCGPVLALQKLIAEIEGELA